MQTYERPEVIALAKALGATPREARKNFELLIYSALRFYTESMTLLLRCGATAALDPDVMRAWPALPPENLFALYRQAVKACPPWSDVLVGVHARRLATTGGEGLGQYFTPEDLALLTASLVSSHRKEHRMTPTDGLYRIHEPTCGAGGLILAQMIGFGDEASSCVIDAWDIDPLCCAMTALQFVANAVEHDQHVKELVVRHGNVLTQKSIGFWVGVWPMMPLMSLKRQKMALWDHAAK